MPPSTTSNDTDSVDELAPELYSELLRLAGAFLATESGVRSFRRSDLAHEAYLRLRGTKPGRKTGSLDEFRAGAAQKIRRVLVDHARRRRAEKRGGGRTRMPLEAALNAAVRPTREFDLVDLDAELCMLERVDPSAAAVIELRFFGGLSAIQTAKHLGVSERKVSGDFRRGAFWLQEKLRERGSGT